MSHSGPAAPRRAVADPRAAETLYRLRRPAPTMPTEPTPTAAPTPPTGLVRNAGPCTASGAPAPEYHVRRMGGSYWLADPQGRRRMGPYATEAGALAMCEYQNGPDVTPPLSVAAQRARDFWSALSATQPARRKDRPTARRALALTPRTRS
jgi:hypothetical protein